MRAGQGCQEKLTLNSPKLENTVPSTSFAKASASEAIETSYMCARKLKAELAEAGEFESESRFCQFECVLCSF